MQQQDAGKMPFFAQFLETQQRTQEAAGQFAGDSTFPEITKPILDMEQTHKYPSDSDEV